jgi:P4 family phage/plasmid primase-like protien
MSVSNNFIEFQLSLLDDFSAVQGQKFTAICKQMNNEKEVKDLVKRFVRFGDNMTKINGLLDVMMDDEDEEEPVVEEPNANGASSSSVLSVFDFAAMNNALNSVAGIEPKKENKEVKKQDEKLKEPERDDKKEQEIRTLLKDTSSKNGIYPVVLDDISWEISEDKLAMFWECYSQICESGYTPLLSEKVNDVRNLNIDISLRFPKSERDNVRVTDTFILNLVSMAQRAIGQTFEMDEQKSQFHCSYLNAFDKHYDEKIYYSMKCKLFFPYLKASTALLKQCLSNFVSIMNKEHQKLALPVPIVLTKKDRINYNDLLSLPFINETSIPLHGSTTRNSYPVFKFIRALGICREIHPDQTLDDYYVDLEDLTCNGIPNKGVAHLLSNSFFNDNETYERKKGVDIPLVLEINDTSNDKEVIEVLTQNPEQLVNDFNDAVRCLHRPVAKIFVEKNKNNIIVTDYVQKKGYIWNDKLKIWKFEINLEQPLIHFCMEWFIPILQKIDKHLEEMVKKILPDDTRHSKILMLKMKFFKLGEKLETISYVKNIISLSYYMFRDETEKFQKQMNIKSKFHLPIKRGLVKSIDENGNSTHNLEEHVVIDLHNGEISPRTREHMFSLECDVEYLGMNVPTPNADKYFGNLTMKNDEYTQNLVEIVGYYLTGDTKLQKMFFIVGRGKNGKSGLVRVLKNMLGGLFTTAQKRAFIKSTGAAHDAELIALSKKNARIAVLPEINEDDELRMDVLKSISGGDEFEIRGCNAQESQEVTISAKTLMLLNAVPVFNGVQSSVKRRCIVLPFNAEFDVDEDSDFTEQIETIYLNEIFTKIVNCGTIKYFENKRKLSPLCKEITECTENAIRRNDPFFDFEDEYLEEKKEGKIKKTRLYDLWLHYSRQPDTHAPALGNGKRAEKTTFHELFKQKYNIKPDSNKIEYYVGISEKATLKADRKYVELYLQTPDFNNQK